MKLAQGLAVTIAAEPDIDQTRFEQLGEGLFKQKSQLRNIAGAPDLVVRLIYPVAPNVKSLGLDYRANEKQRRAALKVLNATAPVLTGPVDLVQGGTGLIARYPVSVRQSDGSNRFWGILAAVMDLDKLSAKSAGPRKREDEPAAAALVRIENQHCQNRANNPSIVKRSISSPRSGLTERCAGDVATPAHVADIRNAKGICRRFVPEEGQPWKISFPNVY